MFIVDTVNIRLDFTNYSHLCIAHRIGRPGYGVFVLVYIRTSVSMIYLNQIVIVCGWDIVSYISMQSSYPLNFWACVCSVHRVLLPISYTHHNLAWTRLSKGTSDPYSPDILVEFGMHPNKWKQYEWMNGCTYLIVLKHCMRKSKMYLWFLEIPSHLWIHFVHFVHIHTRNHELTHIHFSHWNVLFSHKQMD